MQIPDNEPVIAVTMRCDLCGCPAYWDGGTTPDRPGAWRHQAEADAIFCAILDTATQISQL